MALPELAALASRLRACDIDSVESYAWRDLDDPDAGGSEVHAEEILRRWAEAGVRIIHRTSSSPAGPEASRSGYAVVRRGGRYGVFPRVILTRLIRRRRRGTAIVEIWNGVPWFSPMWSSGRGVVWLHHLHDEMWKDSLPRPLAPIGRFLETRLAPRFYRATPVMTLAETTVGPLASRGIPLGNITVVHPGIDPDFAPTGEPRESSPTLVAVGRLAPVKRFEALLDTVSEVRLTVPNVRLHIVGTGPLREHLEHAVASRNLGDAVVLEGRIERSALISLYSRAWLAVSASHAEGWGMTLTEAAACGTPAVVSDNHGHRIAVEHGVTGVVVDDLRDLGREIISLLVDHDRREEMGRAARERSRSFSWDRAAIAALTVLVEHVESQTK